MNRIDSFGQWLAVAGQQKPFLLFVKTNDCSVCDGLLPQITALQVDYPLPFYLLNVVETAEITGQLTLFSAPVILLYNEGKEYARFARFIQMDELKRRMHELVERGKVID